MIINFIKTHPDAKIPTQNHTGTGYVGITPISTSDTGYDLYAVKDTVVPARGSNVVPVGLEVAYIEPGYWFRIEARSGLGFKFGIQPHAGIIDNQYRGDLAVKLYNLAYEPYRVNVGDRIAQLVVYPIIEADMKFVETKEESERGEKGFGSSGN